MRKNLVVDMAAVEEMVLVIENDGKLYRSMIAPVIEMLKRKVKKGTYDKSLAYKAFDGAVKKGCQDYHDKFGSPNEKYYTVFNAVTREQIAKDLVDRYEEQIFE